MSRRVGVGTWMSRRVGVGKWRLWMDGWVFWDRIGFWVIDIGFWVLFW